MKEYLHYTSEVDLFAAFQAAHPAATDAIFNRHFKPLCYFIERITGSLEEAEDIVADTFVKMLERKDQFQNLDNIRAFLYQTARNAGINYYRAVRLHATIHQQLLYIGKNPAEEKDWLEEEAIRIQVLTEIRGEIEQLPTKCREIFKLIFFKGLSTEQIAAEMGIAVQTVRTHKARAIQLLKIQLLKSGKLSSINLFLFFLDAGKFHL